MAVTGVVEDGKLLETASESSVKKATAKNGMDKDAFLQTTDSAENAKQIQGTVEYVTYENGKAFVSINNALYSVDDVIAVIDQTYQTAYDMAVAFCAAMDKLPRVNSLTPDDKEAVETLQKAFNSMTAYQQSFISDDYIKALQEYVERMAELTGDADDDKTDGEEGGDTEESGGTEGSGEGGSEGGGAESGAAQIV